MTNLVAPPPMESLNTLSQLLDLMGDKDAIEKYLAQLTEVSATIYTNLRLVAEKADVLAAKESELVNRDAGLTAREAAISEKEVALHDQSNALEAKLSALRSLVG